MSDGLPTEEQLRRMERTVMDRIRRRAELPRRIATGAAVAALFAGGVLLLPRALTSSGGGSGASSGSGGSTAQYSQDESRSASGGSAGGSAALIAVCHGSPSRTGSVRQVPVSGGSVQAAVDACLAAYRKGLVPRATGATAADLDKALTAKDLVACRSTDGTVQVFPKDAHPSTLCTRNGLRTP